MIDPDKERGNSVARSTGQMRAMYRVAFGAGWGPFFQRKEPASCGWASSAISPNFSSSNI